MNSVVYPYNGLTTIVIFISFSVKIYLSYNIYGHVCNTQPQK